MSCVLTTLGVCDAYLSPGFLSISTACVLYPITLCNPTLLAKSTRNRIQANIDWVNLLTNPTSI
jgi:hypothetical protein